MAIDLSSLLKDHNARPYHLSVIADIFDGQSEDAYPVDAAAAVATAKTAIHTLVDGQHTHLSADLGNMIFQINSTVDSTALSSGDKTALKAAILVDINATIFPDTYFDPLKDDIDDELDADLATVTVNISDILTAAKDYLDTTMAADTTNFPYQDVWCQGAGRYERRRDAGVDPTDTSLKHCDVCDGFGRKATQGEIIIVKPPVTTYP